MVGITAASSLVLQSGYDRHASAVQGKALTALDERDSQSYRFSISISFVDMPWSSYVRE